MRTFSKLHTDFWINPNNRELAQLGLDAQLMALYLQGNSHHNMLGVYYLPMLYIASDLKTSVKKVQLSLNKLCGINYCKYDEQTQYIWICNLAFDQLGEDIDIKDNRIKAIQAIWGDLPEKIEFLAEVYNKYHAAFHLKQRFMGFPTDSLKPASFSNFLSYSINNDKSAEKVEKLRKPENLAETNSNIKIFDDINKPNFTDNDIVLNKSIGNTENITNITDIANIKNKPSDAHRTSILTTIEVPLISASPVFEGAFLIKSTLQSSPMVESSYNFNKTSILNILRASNNTVEMTQLPLQGIADIDVSSSNDPVDNFEVPSNGLTTPFESSSKGLQSPSEAPSKALRSNIDYRIKNIDNRNKKIELKKLEKEKKRDINLNYVPPSNIVAQEKAKTARPDVVGKVDSENNEDNGENKNNLFCYLDYLESLDQVDQDGQVKQVDQVSQCAQANQVEQHEQSEQHDQANQSSQTNHPNQSSNDLLALLAYGDSDTGPLAVPSQIQTQTQSFDFDRSSSVIAAAEHKTELKSTSNGSDKNSVTAIFEYWKEVMQHPRAKIDRKRENLIRSALRLGYSVQDLCDAITGCFRTPFNRGSNDRKQRYDGLHIILRDADHIDAFIHNCQHPPSPTSDADRIQVANVHAASSWIKQKLGDDPSQARRFDSS